jgi:flagellar brake protein
MIIVDSTPAVRTAPVLGAIDDRYALRHPLQVALCLRGLATRRDFLTVEFDDAQIVTQVLDVDSRRACFLFDFGSARANNAALAKSDHLVFRSQPSGVRTEFVTGQALATTFEGRPAFEVSFPELLYYVQRREYYRVDTPMSDPFLATGADPEGVDFRLELQDMSLGGIALRTSDTRFENIQRGTVWQEVTLDMRAFGAVTVDLEIVAPRVSITPTGERRTVLGCRFVDVTGNAERVLQRAITSLETRNLRCAGRD